MQVHCEEAPSLTTPPPSCGWALFHTDTSRHQDTTSSKVWHLQRPCCLGGFMHVESVCASQDTFKSLISHHTIIHLHYNHIHTYNHTYIHRAAASSCVSTTHQQSPCHHIRYVLIPIPCPAQPHAHTHPRPPILSIPYHTHT